MTQGIHPGRYLPVSEKIVEVVVANEQRFSRWSVGFCVGASNNSDHFTEIYRSQWHLLFDLLTSLRCSSLKVTTCQFHRNNYYQKDFPSSINEFY